MKHESLSSKQQETLRTVMRMVEKNGYPPTQRELVTLLGVTQNAVRTRLRALQRKGYIILVPRTARGIVFLNIDKGGRRANAVASSR